MLPRWPCFRRIRWRPDWNSRQGTTHRVHAGGRVRARQSRAADCGGKGCVTSIISAVEAGSVGALVAQLLDCLARAATDRCRYWYRQESTSAAVVNFISAAKLTKAG